MSNPAPLCSHVKTNGTTCGSPAVSGATLCYHHSTLKTSLREGQQAACGSNAPIPFLFPEDRASLQINFFLLLQAFNQKQVDLRTYRAMLSMLKAMAANLGKSGSLVEGSGEAVGEKAASGEAAGRKAVSQRHKPNGPASGLDIERKASAIAPESCFSKNPQVQGTDNDLFRMSPLDRAECGFHQAAQPLARS